MLRGMPDEDLADLLLGDDLLEPREKVRERLGRDILQRLGDHLHFIAHRHADASRSMIQSQNAHQSECIFCRAQIQARIGPRCGSRLAPPQAFFTKHALRPTAMPSTLQEISWSPSTRRIGLDFDPPLSTCRAAEFQVLDQDDAVAVGEHVAVGVLDDARAGGGFGRGGALPLVTARHAFPFCRGLQHFRHFTHRASRFAHSTTA